MVGGRRLHQRSCHRGIVAGAPGQGQQRLGVRPGARELADPEEQVGALAMDGHERGGGRLPQPPADLGGLAEQRERLAQTVGRDGLVGSLRQVVERTLPLLGA